MSTLVVLSNFAAHYLVPDREVTPAMLKAFARMENGHGSTEYAAVYPDLRMLVEADRAAYFTRPYVALTGGRVITRLVVLDVPADPVYDPAEPIPRPLGLVVSATVRSIARALISFVL
jgi:hypothetical protein